MASLRSIGTSGILIAPVAMGCWPIAGITSLNVSEASSVATLNAAVDSGITHFDTAHCYGYAGESESMIGRTFRDRVGLITVATKCGITFDKNKNRITDGRPETLRKHCEISLRRMHRSAVELLYLHAPDPQVPLEESAAALAELKRLGKTQAVGLSNANLEQIKAFHDVCPLGAVQLKYNLLQREIENEIIPWCQSQNIAVMAYWPLMKGLLAGKLPRDHAFAANDARVRYPIFQGLLWEVNQNFVDDLRKIASSLERTVAQITVNWTIFRSGITAALCGAKRPEQIVENAGAMDWRLDDQALIEIEAAYQRWLSDTAGSKLA